MSQVESVAFNAFTGTEHRYEDSEIALILSGIVGRLSSALAVANRRLLPTAIGLFPERHFFSGSRQEHGEWSIRQTAKPAGQFNGAIDHVMT